MTAAEIELVSKKNVERFQDRSGALVASLEIELYRSKRYGRPFSIVIFMLERAQDDLNVAMSRRSSFLDKRIRVTVPPLLRIPDFWGRLDAETFLVALPETEADGAAGFATRVWSDPNFQRRLPDESNKFALSIGVASFSGTIKNVDALVTSARGTKVWRQAEAPGGASASERPSGFPVERDRSLAPGRSDAKAV